MHWTRDRSGGTADGHGPKQRNTDGARPRGDGARAVAIRPVRASPVMSMSVYPGAMPTRTPRAATREDSVPGTAAALVDLLNSRPYSRHARQARHTRVRRDRAAPLRAGGRRPPARRVELVRAVRDHLLALTEHDDPDDSGGDWAAFSGRVSSVTFQQDFSTPGAVSMRQTSGDPVVGRITLAVAELVDSRHVVAAAPVRQRDLPRGVLRHQPQPHAALALVRGVREPRQCRRVPGAQQHIGHGGRQRSLTAGPGPAPPPRSPARRARPLLAPALDGTWAIPYRPLRPSLRRVSVVSIKSRKTLTQRQGWSASP